MNIKDRPTWQLADRLDRLAKKLRSRAMRQHDAALAKVPMKDKLIYAAYSRCPCGAGLAYPADAKPYGDSAYWDCSAILLGEAAEAVQHTAKLPFAFYEIKSENQPSASGATTRPAVQA